jgi:hypothetical protein
MRISDYSRIFGNAQMISPAQPGCGAGALRRGETGTLTED